MKILSHENECVYSTSTTVYTQKQPSCVTLNYEAASCLIALGSLVRLFFSLIEVSRNSARQAVNTFHFELGFKYQEEVKDEYHIL